MLVYFENFHFIFTRHAKLFSCTQNQLSFNKNSKYAFIKSYDIVKAMVYISAFLLRHNNKTGNNEKRFQLIHNRRLFFSIN